MVLPIAEMMTQWNRAHVNGNQKDNTDGKTLSTEAPEIKEIKPLRRVERPARV